MKYIFFTFAMLIGLQSTGQPDLFIPVNFSKAYEKGTRSEDGQPGPNYWQNTASYVIDSRVTPGSWTIAGEAEIIYYNNSPDTLTSLVIRKYPDQYAKGASRDYEVLPQNLTDGMEISSIKVDGRLLESAYLAGVQNTSTVGLLRLPLFLMPGDSTRLEINWTSQLPISYQIRQGAYDDHSAFMAYWYPQVGVYDDIDGWDRHEYRGQQEFYRDFADYQVNITVPKGYKVWATGTLKNAEALLSDKGWHAYKKAGYQNIKVDLTDDENYSMPESNSWTWSFEADNVQDVAAGISDNFTWVTGSVQIGDRRVRSHVVYDGSRAPKETDLLAIQNEAIEFLSNYVAGFEYPYPQFTSFYGVPQLDGMEYPMIANNGFAYDEIVEAELIFHELAHTLFPYYMGINEVKYSWMEEGWAIFLTMRYIQHRYAGTDKADAELKRNLRSFNQLGGSQYDLPLMVPSNLMVVDPSHTLAAYRKPAFMYMVLEDMLGEELFKKCLGEYIERWAGKHPMPYDFTNTFNEVSGQNLDWFWGAWLMRYAYPDLAVKAFDDGGIIVKNVGGLPLPVQLEITYKDGSERTIRRSAATWANGYSEIWIPVNDYEKLSFAKLTPYPFPDVDTSNDSIDK